MSSKEDAIAELSKLLASGALSSEAFAQAVKALNDNDTSNISEKIQQPPEEQSRDEKIYYSVMEFIRNLMKAPSTAKYPPFSECKIENPAYVDTYSYPKQLFIDETTGNPITKRWVTYIDAENSYGAMLRKTCDFVFDENDNLIYARFESGETMVVLPLYIVDDFRLVEDSIESELYEQYMSNFISSTPGYGGCSYPPYNPRMLTEKQEFKCTKLIFKGHYENVTRIRTWVSMPRVPNEIIPASGIIQLSIIIDGKDSFNLIKVDVKW